MSLCKCNDCNNTFDEPKVVRQSYEDYYGVGNLFGNHHYATFDLCPNCGSDDIETCDCIDSIKIDYIEINEEKKETKVYFTIVYELGNKDSDNEETIDRVNLSNDEIYSYLSDKYCC